MARMVKYQQEKDDFVDATYRLRNEAEEEREKEYEAIIKVQAWYRAVRTRAYFRHLHACATIIQKKWRGFLGRRRIREIMQDQVFIMRLNHYNRMTIQIQKVWRGYYTRKYVSNFYSRKRYLEGLKIKNETIRSELEDYVEQQEMLAQMKREKEEKQKLDDYAKRHHHLVSTEVMPGVYNNPFQPYPEEMEFHLRNAKKSLAADNKKEKSKKESFDPSCKKYDLPRLRDPLPPVQAKPQGPFREPPAVQQQRYEPFHPSLRVATDYYSLDKARDNMKQEEWLSRVNDNIFLPFSSKDVPYEKLLHTTSKYGHPSYGTKYFRHEYPANWATQPQNFRSVVPPIPIFEKLNHTYSQGQV